MDGKLYCSVRITDIAYSADKGYAYLVPPSMRDTLHKGSIVLVPFGHGNRLRKGIVTGFSDYCEYPGIKPVSDILEDYGLVSEETVDMCLFMAERCFCTVGAALKAILPPGMESSVEYLYSCGEADDDTLNPKAQVLFRALKEKSMAESEILSSFGEEAKTLLAAMVKSGALNRAPVTVENINEKNLSCVRLTVAAETAYEAAKTEKQQALVDALALEGEISVTELEKYFSVSRSVVNVMCKKQVCEVYERRIVRDPALSETAREKTETTLTDEQKDAAESIEELLVSGEPKACLLFGVTGSGKTKVIIESVKKALAMGKSAIVLIPEIGLTSEAVSIYSAEFGSDLAVVHSMLSIGERIDTARAIAKGEKKVVIGTRSAVFSPVKDLGLIVMDEEQEHTYKSENTPKFHARDIARFRCAYNKCVMLLASATPSVESFYKAKQGIYKLITLSHRYAGASLPEITLADIKQDPKFNGGRLIGTKLGEKLNAAAEQGKQAILFVGRRGYSSFVSCASCGEVVSCPNCSVSLTYHAFSGENRKNEKLNCHYCGYSIPLPETCPSCGKNSITRFGFGTQKLQEELEKHFPSIRGIRMDTDTTATRHSHENRFKSFRNKEADLLYGTQMIAKGLDFPLVSLVGVVSVDAMLYQNDFRAAERTFSLLTQLAGRAGRAGDEGEAVLQTANPQSDILKLVQTQNYEKFFEGEIAMRRAVVFPPFCDIALFRISGENEQDVRRAATAFSVIFEKLLTEKYPSLKMIRFGPFGEGIYKINNRYRMRITVKYKDCAAARSCFRDALSAFAKADRTGALLDIDINPITV